MKKHSRLIVLYGAVPLALAACEAQFTDLRDAPLRQDGAALDLPTPTTDSTRSVDGVSAPESSELARGQWEGRGGYSVAGTAKLLVDGQGTMTLQLSSDFSTSSVPGPVVLLSARTSIGTDIDAATDLHLGPLQSDAGEQVYPLPAPADDRRVAWIYCEPFGIEVGRAVLKEGS